MSEQQIVHYIKEENNSELLYLVAVTCLDRLVKLGKPAVIKAIVDSATACLFNMIKK